MTAGISADRVSVDTNVVVRFLVNDAPDQAARARALIASRPVFITTTVLLETEWVLRAGYKHPSSDIQRFFRVLLGLPQISVAEPEAVAAALAGYEAGLDFADALHLALSGDAIAFATFDGPFAKRAAKLQTRPIIAP